jgi:hypothetical protein
MKIIQQINLIKKNKNKKSHQALHEMTKSQPKKSNMQTLGTRGSFKLFWKTAPTSKSLTHYSPNRQ